eukprot:421260-Pyramimonas_sp.AAC.1
MEIAEWTPPSRRWAPLIPHVQTHLSDMPTSPHLLWSRTLERMKVSTMVEGEGSRHGGRGDSVSFSSSPLTDHARRSGCFSQPLLTIWSTASQKSCEPRVAIKKGYATMQAVISQHLG